jgi:hypothetical protein
MDPKTSLANNSSGANIESINSPLEDFNCWHLCRKILTLGFQTGECGFSKILAPNYSGRGETRDSSLINADKQLIHNGNEPQSEGIFQTRLTALQQKIAKEEASYLPEKRCMPVL